MVTLLCRTIGAILILLAAVLAYQWFTLPDIAALSEANPPSTAFIDRYREANAAADLEWQWTPYDSISLELKRAVVIAEDKFFFDHHGFSLLDIRKSVAEAILERKALRGGSTISQQVAKNLWLTTERTPLRKLREAALTVKLERSLTKHRILEIYLNVAEWAPGVYGIEAAAKNRYGCAASNLTAVQAAALAACLPNPANSVPPHEDEAWRERFEKIQYRAARAGWLDNEL